MIRRDSLSDMLTATAFLLCLYLSTFDLGVLIIFPVVLLTSGILLQYYMMDKPSQIRERQISAKSATNITYYTVIGFVALMGISMISPKIDKLPFLSQMQTLSVTPAIMFTSLIAIGEEQFFRGWLTNYLTKKSVFLGIFGSAAVFAAFHLAVYGMSGSALFYVLASGVLLAWLGVHSGRLFVPMTIHILNNVGVYMMAVVYA